MTEVRVTPGRCVTWKCDRVAHGPECEEHAAEPLPVLDRARNTPEGRSTERERYKQRLATDPAFRERERERKRRYNLERRAREPGWGSGAHYRRRLKQLATESRMDI